MQIIKKDEEIRMARKTANQLIKALGTIREFIGNPGDVMNKVKLFNNKLRKTRHLSRLKVIHILVDYVQKMEKILEEM